MGWPKPEVPKVYSYWAPATEKPPASISALGRVVKALSKSEPLTSRQVFMLAFAPHEDFGGCKNTLGTAQARGYVEKRPGETKRDHKYVLTDKGAAVFAGIAAARR